MRGFNIAFTVRALHTHVRVRIALTAQEPSAALRAKRYGVPETDSIALADGCVLGCKQPYITSSVVETKFVLHHILSCGDQVRP